MHSRHSHFITCRAASPGRGRARNELARMAEDAGNRRRHLAISGVADELSPAQTFDGCRFAAIISKRHFTPLKAQHADIMLYEPMHAFQSTFTRTSLVAAFFAPGRAIIGLFTTLIACRKEADAERARINRQLQQRTVRRRNACNAHDVIR